MEIIDGYIYATIDAHELDRIGFLPATSALVDVLFDYGIDPRFPFRIEDSPSRIFAYNYQQAAVPGHFLVEWQSESELRQALIENIEYQDTIDMS